MGPVAAPRRIPVSISRKDRQVNSSVIRTKIVLGRIIRSPESLPVVSRFVRRFVGESPGPAMRTADTKSLEVSNGD